MSNVTCEYCNYNNHFLKGRLYYADETFLVADTAGKGVKVFLREHRETLTSREAKKLTKVLNLCRATPLPSKKEVNGHWYEILEVEE